MEINEAIAHLLSSDPFKEKAKMKDKDGGRLRMFVTRVKKGDITPASAVSMLNEFGYSIDLKAPKTSNR